MVSFKSCKEILVQMVVCFNCLVARTLDSSVAGQTLSATVLSQKCRLGIKFYSFYFLFLLLRVKINSMEGKQTRRNIEVYITYCREDCYLCVFYRTNEMQLIQCSLLLSALYMFRTVFPPIIRSL